MKYYLFISISTLLVLSCNTEDINKTLPIVYSDFILEDGQYQCITDSGAKTIRNWGREDIIIKKNKEDNYIASRTGYAHPSFHFTYTINAKTPSVLTYADSSIDIETANEKITLRKGDALMKLNRKGSSLIATNIHLAISTEDSLIFNYINK